MPKKGAASRKQSKNHASSAAIQQLEQTVIESLQRVVGDRLESTEEDGQQAESETERSEEQPPQDSPADDCSIDEFRAAQIAEAKRQLVSVFPAKIVELHQLLSSPTTCVTMGLNEIRDLALESTDPAVLGSAVVPSDADPPASKRQKREQRDEVPCLQTLAEETRRMRDRVYELRELAGMIKQWTTLSRPSFSDATTNVKYQEGTADIADVCMLAVDAWLEHISYSQRANDIDELVDLLGEDDVESARVVRQQIVDADIEWFVSSRQQLTTVYHTCVKLYDFIVKNYARLDQSARSAPASSTMHG